MKRTAFLLVGAVALGAAIYAGTLWANPGARPAAQPTTKVGLINITYVIKNYTKYKSFSEELKSSVGKYQAKDTEWKTKGEKLAKERQDPKTAEARKEAIDRELKGLERQIADNKDEAQKVLVKKQEEQIKILYGDMVDVVGRYAQANGFDLIFHYHDPLTKEEYYSAANYARKMNNPGLTPVYTANGLEISQQVVMAMNQQMARPAGGR